MLDRYARFFAIGAAIGLSAIVVRELLGATLPRTPFAYWLSVLLVYAAAVSVGYRLQGTYAFAQPSSSLKLASKTFVRYVAVAAASAISTSLLAVGIRYGSTLEHLAGGLADAVAFALASVIVSIATFAINLRVVFRQDASP